MLIRTAIYRPIRLSSRDKNKTTKVGILSAPAKHSMGKLRLYESNRIAKRHWVCQSKDQKPRGGSRGAVTRIFPAVSPGRGGVVRGNLLVRPPACQLRSTPSSVRPADSIPMERKLTHMKSNSFVRSVALLAVTALAVPVFAKPISKTISITQAAKVGKADLGRKRRALGGSRREIQLRRGAARRKRTSEGSALLRTKARFRV